MRNTSIYDLVYKLSTLLWAIIISCRNMCYQCYYLLLRAFFEALFDNSVYSYFRVDNV